MEFKVPSMKDKEKIEHYFSYENSRSCDRCFTNIYLWAYHYNVLVGYYKNAAIFKSTLDGEDTFSFPIGEEKSIKELLENLFRDYGEKLIFYNITKDQEVILKDVCSQFGLIEKYNAIYNRDSADYIYEREKLETLSGKKLHGKRNHINKFMSLYGNDYSIEDISSSNIEECRKMGEEWREINKCEEDTEKSAEMCVTFNALKLMSDLDLKGILLRVKGRVIAFTIGEKLSSDTFVVHIEKALSEYEGAYQVINQEFVKRHMKEFVYVNREEDLGDSGLRHAKESYKPAFLEEKAIVKFNAN